MPCQAAPSGDRAAAINVKFVNRGSDDQELRCEHALFRHQPESSEACILKISFHDNQFRGIYHSATPRSTWQQQLRIGPSCANKREHKKPKSVTSRRLVADGGSDNVDQTESLFHTYSQFASKADLPSKPSDEEQHVEKELNEILEKVRAVWHGYK